MSIARSQGVAFEFVPADLGDVHPNSVRIEIITEEDEEISMSGSSVGVEASKYGT